MQTIKVSREVDHMPRIGKGSNTKSKSTNKVPHPKTEDIAMRAYYKAEARGYEPGHEIQDWLDAEAEIAREIKEK